MADWGDSRIEIRLRKSGSVSWRARKDSGNDVTTPRSETDHGDRRDVRSSNEYVDLTVSCRACRVGESFVAFEAGSSVPAGRWGWSVIPVAARLRVKYRPEG